MKHLLYLRKGSRWSGEIPEDARAVLRTVEWSAAPSPSMPDEVAGWLLETGSMTRCLESRCRRLTVRLCFEGFVASDGLDDEREQLPDCRRYWLREVVLCGDGVPWLFGRTLVPERTLEGGDEALMEIGCEPLGRYLFREQAPERDYIHTGYGGGLWARRSRLRLSGGPLLLTELFLPGAPLYF